MPKPEFKNCPFCGTSEDIKLVRENPERGYPIYYVMCSRVCGAKGSIVEYLWDLGVSVQKTRARAISRWNRRLDKEVREEDLQEELKNVETDPYKH